MPNPIFPFNEYIPDGEPHVFNERVFLYGSHDKEDGDRFCMLDYSVYSAPVSDLSNWTCHGISYSKDEDPRSKGPKLVDYYAPDCVKGNDGRYYLYYVAMGPNTLNFGPISVAVSDKPEGPFNYLHDIVNKEGEPLLKYLTNDPCVINDEGHIYLYYGWGLGRDFRGKILSPIYKIVQEKLFNRTKKQIKETKPSIFSCAFIELEDDMFTVKRGPLPVLDSKTTANKYSELYKHPFYEAPSIRKINDTYYLIYSSGANNELCYATSNYPDRDFIYKGVIISNSDLGYENNKIPKMYADTIHGSIEFINKKWYVFYHRLTRHNNFSRQACAEEIKINNDGTIPQVEITSQGIDGKPLLAEGIYSSFYACNIYNEKVKKSNKIKAMFCKENDDYIISNIKNGYIVGYKYFLFKGDEELIIYVKGGKGKLVVSDGTNSREILIKKTDTYIPYKTDLLFIGFKPLFIKYIGKESINLLSIEFRRKENENN